MSFFIGLDIGGTKIAGAVYDENTNELAQSILATPKIYSDLVTNCQKIISDLDQKINGANATIGIGIPGSVDHETGIVPFAANTPCLNGQPLQKDLEKLVGRRVRIANDADCAALSEAMDGAGAGYKTVLGLIMGTGVGAGLIANGRIVEGANGLTGEFGHIPLPFREFSDGPFAPCACKQQGCIDKSISGSGLARLYEMMTGKSADAVQIAAAARSGNKDASRVLDQFYTVVAKAMVPVIHMFDPHVIAVSGGLSDLPSMYDAVSQRMGRYAATSNLRTKFVPAKFGALSGLRGAAWVGRQV